MELVLYALDEAGAPAFAQRLSSRERSQLHEIAERHLAHHHAVEVWEGPTCVLRLRRAPGAA